MHRLRHVWRQDTSRAAEPPAKLSRRGLRWAINGRPEHLRGSAPGFRNRTTYIARSLLEADAGYLPAAARGNPAGDIPDDGACRQWSLAYTTYSVIRG